MKKENFIGTRNESSLHKTLKFQYTEPGGKTEILIGEFVADGINKSGEIIEVQTGSFAPLKKKVKDICVKKKMRIIHPVAVSKMIEVYEATGKFLYRRKSPKKGSMWNIFDVLLHAPELPLEKNLVIELAMIDITEIRVKDGKGSWRRKGVSIRDKLLSAWHERLLFKSPKDFFCFLPFKKEDEFTVSCLAEKTGIKPQTARKALYVLAKMKMVKKTGKKRNARVYSVLK